MFERFRTVLTNLCSFELIKSFRREWKFFTPVILEEESHAVYSGKKSDSRYVQDVSESHESQPRLDTAIQWKN